MSIGKVGIDFDSSPKQGRRFLVLPGSSAHVAAPILDFLRICVTLMCGKIIISPLNNPQWRPSLPDTAKSGRVCDDPRRCRACHSLFYHAMRGSPSAGPGMPIGRPRGDPLTAFNPSRMRTDCPIEGRFISNPGRGGSRAGAAPTGFAAGLTGRPGTASAGQWIDVVE